MFFHTTFLFFFLYFFVEKRKKSRAFKVNLPFIRSYLPFYKVRIKFSVMKKTDGAVFRSPGHVYNLALKKFHDYEILESQSRPIFGGFGFKKETASAPGEFQ